jgi:glycosyltransferase involved in cell wall biosynthesis
MLGNQRVRDVGVPPEVDVKDRLLASVVVPAHQKAPTLRQTLSSLVAQSLGPDQYEIIVVDDASTDGTAAVIEDLRATAPRLAYCSHRRRRGAATARNTGLAASRGEVVIFIDADVVASPELVEQHVRCHRHEPNVAAIGRTFGRETTPDSWPVQLHDHRGWDELDIRSRLDRARHEPGLRDLLNVVSRSVDDDLSRLAAPWSVFWTGNASVRAEALRAVGGFDTSFPRKGNEDIELGYRLHRHGHAFRYLRGADAFHLPHPRNRLRELIVDRQNEVRFLQKFPCLDVEAICSFDILNGNAILPSLHALAAKDGIGSYTAALAAELPDLAALTRRGPSLLIGYGRGWPDALRIATATDIQVETAGQVRAAHPETEILQLLGTLLPFPPDHFAATILTDFWRQLPTRLLARVLDEACRVGEQVFLLKTAGYAVVEAPGFAEAVEAFDRPFWEHSLKLRRELHDFTFDHQDVTDSHGAWLGSLIRVGPRQARARPSAMRRVGRAAQERRQPISGASRR